ncbi:MAG TPA: GntR family transcriptional regulator, partial [Rhodoferax sp.]|nr:GntR family transcriptional regulator [Rhodoferax sp.]
MSADVRTPNAREPRTAVAESGQVINQRARAYQGFTQQILSGKIRSGQFVSQRELMTLLDMPLAAVREMIPRLEAGGLIKTVPQRGLQIAHVDLKLIRNAFQVRTLIEREAVQNFVHIASDSELQVIEASHQDILSRASALGQSLASD